MHSGNKNALFVEPDFLIGRSIQEVLPQEAATALNQRTNLKILRSVKAACLRARGLPVPEEPPFAGEEAPLDAWSNR